MEHTAQQNDRSETALSFLQRAAPLYEALTNGLGLEGILRAAYGVFQNPLLVADSSFRLLAHIEPEDLDNPLWAQIIGAGSYPKQYVQRFLENDALYGHVMASTAALKADPTVAERYLSRDILVDGRRIGFVTCVEAVTALREEDIRLFDVLWRVVATELRGRGVPELSGARQYDRLLLEILSASVSPETLHERVRQSGLTLERHLYVLTAETRSMSSQKDYLLEYCRTALEQTVAGSLGTVYHGALVFLISRSRPLGDSDSFWANTGALLKDYHMIAGLSDCFYDLAELRAYYGQASAAISAGLRLGLEEPLLRYSGVAWFRLLDAAGASTDLRRFCAPKLNEILAYDRQYHSKFFSTLKAYFHSGRNPKLAAQALGVHRNTVDYRMEKMEELFRLDFSDAETAFALELSLHILRYLDCNPARGPSSAETIDPEDK